MKKYNNLECILLVDDDEITNYIQAREIRKADLDVYIQETKSGKDALDYLQKSGKFAETPFLPQPGIIILDLNMPGMTGWDFIAEYRKLKLNKAAKQIVIILTTSVNPDDQTLAATMPEIAGFMRKPLQTEKLQAVIDQHFGN